jgi:hypothetical protein
MAIQIVPFDEAAPARARGRIGKFRAGNIVAKKQGTASYFPAQSQEKQAKGARPFGNCGNACV